LLTKSVAICVISGVLASTPLPVGLGVVPVHAKDMAVKNKGKVSHAHAVAHLVRQGRKRRSSSSKKIMVATASTRSPISAAQEKTHRPPSTRQLGTFTVRAYTHNQGPDGAPSKTVSGTIPTAGRTVAVDPQVIPLGSKIDIAGVGERIAEDSGGRIKGKSLDLFLPSIEHCRQFGVRWRDVQMVLE